MDRRLWIVALVLSSLSHAGADAFRSFGIPEAMSLRFQPEVQEEESVPPAGLVRGPIRLTGHTHPIGRVRFSPDGKMIATASNDHTIGLWDAGSGASLAMLQGHTHMATDLAFATGGMLASGSLDKTVRLWDVKNRRETACFKDLPGIIGCVALAPNLSLLAAGDDRGNIHLWDPRTLVQLAPLRSHDGIVRSLEFSPDSSRILSVGADKTLLVWDARARKILHRMDVACGSSRARFSPDGNWITSAETDHAVRIWDASTGKLLRTLQGPSSPVFSVSISPDGRLAAAGDVAGILRLWEVGSGQEIAALKTREAQVYSVDFSPDGKRIVAGLSNLQAHLWSFHEKKPDPPLTADRLTELWGKLSDPEAPAAYDALWRLSAVGDSGIVSDAEKRVGSGKPDADRIGALIGKLEDDAIEVRAKAALDLRAFATEAALKKAGQATESPEVREAIVAILRDWEAPEDRSPEETTSSRALQILEAVGSEEAVQALRRIAQEVPVRNARAARAALVRLGK